MATIAAIRVEHNMHVADDMVREQARAQLRRQIDDPKAHEAAADRRVELSDARRGASQ